MLKVVHTFQNNQQLFFFYWQNKIITTLEQHAIYLKIKKYLNKAYHWSQLFYQAKNVNHNHNTPSEYTAHLVFSINQEYTY